MSENIRRRPDEGFRQINIPRGQLVLKQVPDFVAALSRGLGSYRLERLSDRVAPATPAVRRISHVTLPAGLLGFGQTVADTPYRPPEPAQGARAAEPSRREPRADH